MEKYKEINPKKCEFNLCEKKYPTRGGVDNA